MITVQSRLQPNQGTIAELLQAAIASARYDPPIEAVGKHYPRTERHWADSAWLQCNVGARQSPSDAPNA